MKIVLAFDSFKGSLSAVRACAAAAEGLARLAPAPQVVSCPLSDGGEGFAEALCLAARGEMRRVQTTGPLGDPIRAKLVLLDEGRTAVIEAAQACGLHLVPRARRNPLFTTHLWGGGDAARGGKRRGTAADRRHRRQRHQ